MGDLSGDLGLGSRISKMTDRQKKMMDRLKSSEKSTDFCSIDLSTAPESKDVNKGLIVPNINYVSDECDGQTG